MHFQIRRHFDSDMVTAARLKIREILAFNGSGIRIGPKFKAGFAGNPGRTNAHRFARPSRTIRLLKPVPVTSIERISRVEWFSTRITAGPRSIHAPIQRIIATATTATNVSFKALNLVANSVKPAQIVGDLSDVEEEGVPSYDVQAQVQESRGVQDEHVVNRFVEIRAEVILVACQKVARPRLDGGEPNR